MSGRLRAEKDARPGPAARRGLSGSATSCSCATAVRRGCLRRRTAERGLRRYALRLLAAAKEVSVKVKVRRSVTSRRCGLIGAMRVWCAPRL